MIQVFYVLLPPDGDGIEPSDKSFGLPGVPSKGNMVMIWDENKRFLVDHVHWWPGAKRADIVGRWDEPVDKSDAPKCSCCGAKGTVIWTCTNCGDTHPVRTEHFKSETTEGGN